MILAVYTSNTTNLPFPWASDVVSRGVSCANGVDAGAAGERGTGNDEVRHRLVWRGVGHCGVGIPCLCSYVPPARRSHPRENPPQLAVASPNAQSFTTFSCVASICSCVTNAQLPTLLCVPAHEPGGMPCMPGLRPSAPGCCLRVRAEGRWRALQGGGYVPVERGARLDRRKDGMDSIRATTELPRFFFCGVGMCTYKVMCPVSYVVSS